MHLLKNVKRFCLSTALALMSTSLFASDLPELERRLNVPHEASLYAHVVPMATLRASSIMAHVTAHGIGRTEITPIVTLVGRSEVTVTPHLKKAINNVMRASFANPKDARYRDLRVLTNEDHFLVVACGQVAAKDVQGKYADFKPFMLIMANPHAASDMQPVSFLNELWVGEGCDAMGIGPRSVDRSSALSRRSLQERQMGH